MFRSVKTIAVVVAAAISAVVAVPAASANAAEFSVRITYQGSASERGWIAVKTGSTFLLESDVSTDLPVTSFWAADIDTGVGRVLSDLVAPKLRLVCDVEGIMEIRLDVVDEAGDPAFDVLGVYCQDPPTAEIEPRPTSFGKREVIPVGTEITFTSVNWLSVLFDSEWRTTGVKGIAEYGEKYTRTFDKLGNYGVELTEVNEVGRSKVWVGYTVIGPPEVAVSPAPPKGTDHITAFVGETVTFDGSRSRSPGGGTLGYEWRTTGTRGVAGDEATFARKFDKVGNYAISLTVTNEVDQTAVQRVAVSVIKPEAPVVSVTPAPKDPQARMTVKLGTTMSFDGRASKDPDGGSLKFAWSTTGRRGVVATSSTYSRKFDKVGNYGVELVVTDDEGQTAKRWVGLTVVR